MSYVDVDDENFNNFINKKYAKYKIPKEKKTMREICYPKQFQLQLPQLFLAQFINPKTIYKGVLIYHGLGSGKTITAIEIAENFKNKSAIIIVLPASLQTNFQSELRSPIIGNYYLTDTERLILKNNAPSSEIYKDIIRKSDARIAKYYTIYSYDIFVRLLKQNKLDFDNTLLIIDEAHNMISETGTRYEELYNAVHSADDSLRLVLLTGTPIKNLPSEIALTMNLLLPEDNQLPTDKEFVKEFMNISYTKNGPVYSVKNMDYFKETIRGYVSYFRGADPISYPRSEIFFVKTKMSNKQYRLYKKIIRVESKNTQVKDYVNEEISNSFFIATRAVSNIVFPNNKLGEKGFESMTDDDYTVSKMRELSPKFVKILRKIKKCEGTVFVYSNFKQYAGLKTFAAFLEHQHFKNYETAGPGSRRYSFWTGGENKMYKEEVRAVFNNKNNADGSQIKVILGSASIREGVTLLRLQEIHLIDVSWNFSKMNQIIGRGIRFCSHKDVPYDKQLVNVYFYLATDPDIKVSIDEYILKMAINKEIINKQFEKNMKEAAIDCELFKNANTKAGEDDYICDS